MLTQWNEINFVNNKKKYFYVHLSTVDTPVEANTTNMDVASNPPSKTDPSKKFNFSSDIIVIDSDLDSEHSSFTEKTVPPPNTKTVPETPPSDDDQSNDTELNSGN